jgi:hypothetical protein
MNTAIKEMERLRHASAWSPLSKYVAKQRNQWACFYTFEDGSRLGVYFNGDASWFHRNERGETMGEQRWPNWHHCNT